jgi:acetolactate synthase-1/3 small subunit
MGQVEKHTISVLVENKFGVLARVAGLFSGRGYNIKSLTVNETHDPKVSKMTIVTTGDEAVLEQIDKQLNKLVDVIKVDNLTGSKFIERELVLIKVNAETAEKKSQIIQMAEVFEAKIVSVHKNELGIELSGRSDKIDNFVQLVEEFGIVEMARSGRVAVSREPGVTQEY